MKHKILSIGEILWDVLPDKTILGGAPANLAFRLHELGEESYIISRVGIDKLGNEAVSKLNALGLSAKYIQKDPYKPTGTVIVRFDEFRNPDYVIVPDVAYDYIGFTHEIKELAAKADCIAFGTLAQRSEVSSATITSLIGETKQAIKFYDINLRKDCYSLISIERSLYYADILKANHHEAFELGRIFETGGKGLPDVCRTLSAHFNIPSILVTLEEKGVFMYSRNEGEHYVPGYRVKLEDPLGAGDAFSAGFIHALLSGKSNREACEAGNLLGAILATKKGATESIRTEEKNKLMTENLRIVDEKMIEYLNSPT